MLRRKRKRGQGNMLGVQKPLQLKEVYLERFSVQQIWEQARRILEASSHEAETSLQMALHAQGSGNGGKKASKKRDNEDTRMVLEDSSEPERQTRSSDDQYSDVHSDGMAVGNGEPMQYGSASEVARVERDSVESTSLSEDHDQQEDFRERHLSEQPDLEAEGAGTFKPDKFGLNDGFFSIDDFNRQSEFLEQQDARGEIDGASSDEEEVDWAADPFNLTSAGMERESLENPNESSSKDDEDVVASESENANFIDADLSDIESDSEPGVETADTGAAKNTNDIRYADFFASPPHRASKSDRPRALSKTQPQSSTAVPRQETEDDIQRTISAVQRDIFDDDLSPNEDGSEKHEDHHSSHQKRQAALTAEIRRLEAAAVAKRDWTLSGEARAADRPINSLLEEDLEFERAGKPIPVITQKVSEDIEELIKRRILAREFDEVIKRRPGNLVTGNGADVRRGRFEIEDTKPQQSLAEVYETDYLKTADPEGYTDKKDKKLKTEHVKIEQMWRDVSAKLDALSSWHYKPKPPSASINVIADVPTISMEDARPSAGGDVGGESTLAPQEVYRAGEARNKREEVVTGSGLPVARNELTRDEKTRRRRREKERIRKAGGVAPAKGGTEGMKKIKEKQEIVGDLKKGSVKLIGKEGDIRDVEGKFVNNKGIVGRGAGGYKM